jgi:Uma2 family endonuclease
MAVSTTAFSLDDYVTLYEQEGPFEIINGERIPLMPPVAIHVLVIRSLFRVLDPFCQQNNLGQVFTEMPFVLVFDQNWVRGSRVPDLLFVGKERWQSYIEAVEDWYDKPLVLVPDLVVEVVSANDLYTDVQAKVERYIADGVKLVWVIDPKRRQITAFEDGRYSTMTDTLDGGDVCPGFSVALADLLP